MTTPINQDLNQVIESAVTARVEAAVLEALSGSETIGKMVVAALQQPIEVNRSGGYGKDKVPFLNHLISSAIREAAKDAVKALMINSQHQIEAEVSAHLRRQIPEIASTLVGQLVDVASKTYGINVTLRMPSD